MAHHLEFICQQNCSQPVPCCFALRQCLFYKKGHSDFNQYWKSSNNRLQSQAMLHLCTLGSSVATCTIFHQLHPILSCLCLLHTIMNKKISKQFHTTKVVALRTFFLSADTQFFWKLGSHLSQLHPNVDTILGSDFHASLIICTDNSYGHIIGPHGLPHSNAVGELMLELACQVQICATLCARYDNQEKISKQFHATI